MFIIKIILNKTMKVLYFSKNSEQADNVKSKKVIGIRCL